MFARTSVALLVFCGAATELPAQAGLSHVAFLALQQQLRDEGCGNKHVTGQLDAPTRAAIKTCKAKHNLPATASAGDLLVSMNIGFGPDNMMSSGASSRSGAGGAMAPGHAMSGADSMHRPRSGKMQGDPTTKP